MKRASEAQWAERVRRWRESGLTAREYARREQLNARTLGWWSSRLKRKTLTRAAFVEVKTAAPPEEGRIEIVLLGEVRIRVTGAFDAEVLRRVVTALERR